MGAKVGPAQLSTCVHCETLRVVEGESVRFLRRALDPSRVLAFEPPCLPLPRFVPPVTASRRTVVVPPPSVESPRAAPQLALGFPL